MAVHRFEATIRELKELSPSVKHFRLSSPSAFTFKPGQFVVLSVPNPSGKLVKRSYSIASPPKADEFELCVKGVPGGEASPYLFSRKEGDTLQCQGPLGAFVVKDEANALVLVGTGTGVAPYRAMVQDLLERGFKKNILLLCGYRHEEEVLYDKEFSHLAKLHDNFHYHPVVSRPAPGYRGAVGRVQQLIEAYAKEVNADFYLCGLTEMIDDVKKLLEEKGAKRIFFERYD
ncbi:MAG: FAD-binding oxidoreductase [Nanoarchaeota archaeon]|nr:FAD-binding oxidoreductase [Nanoarchaeota archaeon]